MQQILDQQAQRDQQAQQEVSPSRWSALLSFCSVGWASLLVALGVGVSPGYFAFPLVLGDSSYLADNSKLSQLERLFGFGAVVASLGLMVGGFLVFRRLRRRRTEEPLLDSLRGWNRKTLWVLALPWVPILLIPKVEVTAPWLVIVAAAAMAAVVGCAVYWSRFSSWASGSVGGGRLAAMVTVLLATVYAGLFAYYSVRHHHALGSRTFDLGIYDNIFWHTSHGNLLGSSLIRSGSHISAHFDPLLVLLAPLYRLAPRAEFLLVLQSLWLASGAIPLFLLARRKLGNPWLAVMLAAVYLLYPALHGVNMYDFHSLALAGPLLIAALAALELRAVRTYALFVGLLLLTREDMSLVLIGMGAYAVFALGRRRLGLVTIAVAGGYLLVVKLFVMPDPGLFMQNTPETYGYAYYYADLIPFASEGASGLLLSLLTNPLFTLQHVATEPKLRFLFLLFLPLLFVPLALGGRRVVVLLYGFAFLFLSSRSAVHSIHFQYTTVLAPLALALTPVVLASFGEKRGRLPWGVDRSRLPPALVVGMLVTTVALSAKFGAILPNESFRAGFSKHDWSPSTSVRETYASLRQAIETIPADASVSATRRLGPHISNRREAFTFPREADFVLVHRGDLSAKDRSALDALRGEKGYGTAASFGPIVLLQKGAKPGAEAAGPDEGAAPTRRFDSRSLPRLTVPAPGQRLPELELQRED